MRFELVLLFGYSLFLKFGNGYHCFHPSTKKGYCVSKEKCKYSLQIQTQIRQPTSLDVKEIFKNTFECKEEGGASMTCCPCSGVILGNHSTENCFCKDKESCVNYTECPDFLKLIRTLASSRHIIRGAWWLVIDSWRCDDTNRAIFKVCCPTLKKTKYEDHPNHHILAPSSVCGKTMSPTIKTRIVGGREARLGQFPWMANVGYEKIDKRYGTVSGIAYECGGVVISKRYVLTAAHCIEGLPEGRRGPVTIRLGEFDLTKSRDCIGGVCAPSTQNFQIESIVSHANYSGLPNLYNDIALIRLKRPYKENPFVNSICLPFQMSESRVAKSKPFIFVAGWGATDRRGRKFPDVLQYLELDLFDLSKCQKIYKSYGSNISTEGLQICAGGLHGRDSCGGDSGSGLMLENEKNGRWTAIGVVSFGPRTCGQEGVPAVYTAVQQYLQWILDNVKP